MTAKVGDLIRIKDVNMLSLYYSVQKISNIIEHPVSKRLGYTFKINEQEVWVDDSLTQTLIPEENKTSLIEKMVSLRVILNSASILIRSFGINDPAFDYCLQVCADANEMDPSYQKIISDFHANQEIDKNELLTVSAKYYDALDTIEKALVNPEVAPNVYTKLVSLLQSVKSEYIDQPTPPVVAQELPPTPIVEQPPVENVPETTVEPTYPDGVNCHPDPVGPIGPVGEPGLQGEVAPEESSIDLEKEEITEQINFLQALLSEEGVDKDKINAEISKLNTLLSVNENELSFKPGDKVKLKKESHEEALSYKNDKVEGKALTSYAKYSPDEIYTVDHWDGSNIAVKDSEGNDVTSINHNRFELIDSTINENWVDVLGFVVPPLIGVVGIIGALMAAEKQEMDSTFSPKDEPVVMNNIQMIYSKFKEFLNQSSDKAEPEWNKLTPETFDSLVDQKKAIPEIQKNQFVDLVSLLKDYEQSQA